MSKVFKVTDDTFSEAINNFQLLVIELWAQWCMPCKMVAPIVDELAKKYDGRIAFGKLNIDENKNVPSQYGVMSIPTLLIFKEGELADRIVGALPKEKIEEKLKAYL